VDATSCVADSWQRLAVSILIHSGEWMRQKAAQAQIEILAFQSSSTPESGCDSRAAFASIWPCPFQSSSTPESGCDMAATVRGWGCRRFNPHPLRRVDATRLALCYTMARYVSILIHSGEWMRRSVTSRPRFQRRFQSSSTPESGCDAERRRVGAVSAGFQSSSTPESGCDCVILGAIPIATSFNPHPLRRVDATSMTGATLRL